MVDIPILFAGPMVLRLLDEWREPESGKRMTRRLAWREAKASQYQPSRVVPSKWQKVMKGDRLWVRERARVLMVTRPGANTRVIQIRYEADGATAWVDFPERLKYKPIAGKCLNMGTYREASRITLDVTANKMEKLQAISDDDVWYEGLRPWGGFEDGRRLFHFATPGNEHVGGIAPDAFKDLWNHLHGKRAWAKNPDVVALSFKVRKVCIDDLKAAA